MSGNYKKPFLICLLTCAAQSQCAEDRGSDVRQCTTSSGYPGTERHFIFSPAGPLCGGAGLVFPATHSLPLKAKEIPFCGAEPRRAENLAPQAEGPQKPNPSVFPSFAFCHKQCAAAAPSFSLSLFVLFVRPRCRLPAGGGPRPRLPLGQSARLPITTSTTSASSLVPRSVIWCPP